MFENTQFNINLLLYIINFYCIDLIWFSRISAGFFFSVGFQPDLIIYAYIQLAEYQSEFFVSQPQFLKNSAEESGNYM